MTNVFYGSCALGSTSLTSKIYTQVSYHQKMPLFGDEIRIRLPFLLGEEEEERGSSSSARTDYGLYLLFTFYHVHCKVIPQGLAQEDVIEYPVLPLSFVDKGKRKERKKEDGVVVVQVDKKEQEDKGGQQQSDTCVIEEMRASSFNNKNTTSSNVSTNTGLHRFHSMAVVQDLPWVVHESSSSSIDLKRLSDMNQPLFTCHSRLRSFICL